METLVAPLLSDYEADRRKPMPSKNHAFIQTNLTGILYAYRKQYRIATEIRIENKWIRLHTRHLRVPTYSI
ncbi:hypothetical protein [Spirosoma areae]